MKSSDERTDRSGSVIDLARISNACRDLVAWYDKQLAGEQPKVTELERIVTALEALPAIPGRLGRDIDLVTAGGASPGDTVGAIERLRLIASHNPAPPPRQTPRPRERERRTRPRRRDNHKQDPLPGLGSPPTEATQ